MTYFKEEYTLHNGKKIYALYDDHNVCKVTKECIEMLIDLYQQGRADAIDEFARKLYEGCNEMIETCGSNIAPISWAEAYADFKVDIEEIAERLKEQICQ